MKKAKKSKLNKLIAAATVVVLGSLGFALSSDASVWEGAPHMTVDEVEAVLFERLKGHGSTAYRASAHELALHLVQEAEAHGFRPEFVLSLIQTESSFKLDARSNVGARGLMQLMPVTAHYIARKSHYEGFKKAKDLFNPYINISLGIRYLEYLREKFDSNEEHFLAAYNMGPSKLLQHLSRGNAVPVMHYVNSIRFGEAPIRDLGRRLVTFVANL